MLKHFPDTKSMLQIPFHRLEATNDGVTIIKNKAILNRKFLFMLLFVALVSFFLWTVLKKSPNAFQQPPDIKGVLIIAGFGIYFGVTLYLSFKRFKRLISNFKVTRQDGSLIINNKAVIHSGADKQPVVVIQDVAASGGVGGSYTVGISVGKLFFGLCYELDRVDATKAAKYLSVNLGLKLEEREAVAFPLFKLH